jgi:2-methylisocitrate lyase-like PEP mutase family enzyme
MEAGYGNTANDVAASVALAAKAGVVGINLEDKNPASREMIDTDEQAQRIAGAAASGLFINARCDLFIVTPGDAHDDALVDATLARAHVYADVGASGLFVPFVSAPKLIARLCAESPLPVNILIGSTTPSITELVQLGVARISHGHGPWAVAMERLTADARAVYGSA